MDPCLNDGFRTLIAGEKRYIESSIFKACSIPVEYSIKLRMAYIKIFGVKRVTLTIPGEIVVAAAAGHTVISH